MTDTTPRPSMEDQEVAARTIVRHMVKLWQASEQLSAVDLLEECCALAHESGIVTIAEVQQWMREEVA
jgi:hypothetical protein